RQYGLGPIGFRDYREAMPHVDAVILALPNNLHASVGVELLSQGIHVLCEKPLALSRDEGEQLCRAARAARAVLAVGFVTRFFPSTELTIQLIESGLLGDVKSSDYEFGSPAGWAALSGYPLARATAGGVQDDITAVGTPAAGMEPNYAQLQLHDFVHAIQTGAAPKVDGEQGCKSVALAERCYAVPKSLPEPGCEAPLERLSRAVTP